MDLIRQHDRYMIIVLACVYLIGVIGFSLDLTRELFKSTVPFTLLLSLFSLATFHKNYSLRFVIMAVIIYLAGFGIEIAGVATGKVFGYYDYGHTLGLKVLDTPLLIGVNWLTLVYMVWILLSDFNIPKILICILGPAILTLYDMILEPVAVWTDMWTWGGEVPTRNYLAWFVISFVFFVMIAIINPGIKNKIAPALFVIQLAFFILLNLAMKFLI